MTIILLFESTPDVLFTLSDNLRTLHYYSCNSLQCYLLAHNCSCISCLSFKTTAFEKRVVIVSSEMQLWYAANLPWSHWTLLASLKLKKTRSKSPKFLLLTVIVRHLNDFFNNKLGWRSWRFIQASLWRAVVCLPQAQKKMSLVFPSEHIYHFSSASISILYIDELSSNVWYCNSASCICSSVGVGCR